MLKDLFRTISEAEKNESIARLVQHASPRPDFFLMLMLAIAMAAFGVLLNSTVILIGSMLIAPLLYPLLTLSLGVIATDDSLISRSAYTLLQSTILGLAAAFVIGLLFSGVAAEHFAPLGVEVGGGPSLMYALVAVIAGFAAAFATTKPQLSEALPGVAIAVTLVPPLAVAGIGVATLNWPMVSNAFLLYAVNVVGIMFSAMIVFALFEFAVKKRVTQEAVREDVKEIEKEHQKAEQAA